MTYYIVSSSLTAAFEEIDRRKVPKPKPGRKQTTVVILKPEDILLYRPKESEVIYAEPVSPELRAAVEKRIVREYG